MRFEDDASFAKKLVFGLGKALVGDDLAVDFIGGVGSRLQQREGFIELCGVSWGADLGGRGAEVVEVTNKPSGAGGSKALVDGGFVEG